MIKASALVPLLVLILHLYKADAIRCYQCNSAYDPRCGNPFDAYSIASIDCNLKSQHEHLPNMTATLCRKTVQKVYGKIRIVRECGYLEDPERDDKACVKRSGTHDVFAVYCSCTTELCNAGILHRSSSYMIVMPVITMFLVTFFNPFSKIVHWSL